MDNPFQLTFTLKQHTPLIHFHDQTGATLRATEVKPKLDKFIVEKIIEEKNHGTNLEKAFEEVKIHLVGYSPKEESKLKDRFINDGYRALNYKLRLSADLKSAIDIKIINAEKKAHIYNNIAGNFLFLQTELKDIVKKLIVDFFSIHNFGNRQSKGYGCFTIDEINNKKIDFNFKNILTKNGFFVYEKEEKNDIRFRIDRDWQILKSGFNLGGNYRKSILFDYMCNEGIRWEKRIIKQNISVQTRLNFKLFYKHPPVNCPPSEKQYNYKYARALLGLAENNEYLISKTDPVTGKDVVDREYKFIVRFDHLPEKENEKIERIASPITFKVLNDKIYIIAKSINPFVLGKDFKIELGIKHNRDQASRFGSLIENISTPEKFELKEFLKYAMPILGYN